MLRALTKLGGLTLLIVILGGGVLYWQTRDSAQQQISELKQKNEALQQFVARLSAERRVADVLVLDKDVSADGVTRRTLLFVEYDRSGQSMAPRQFVVEGDMTHIDAMVIQFDRQYVGSGDVLRGQSIALFTRIYGDRQNPADAPRIDEPGKIPLLYRSTDPQLAAFERQLWNEFWQLADNPQHAASRGVRVAFGQGVWGPLERDKLYTLTLDNAGGLTLQVEPLKAIYREALRQAGRD
jgi:hypothetical protein